MHKYFTIILVAFLFLAGCSKKTEEEIPKKIDGQALMKLVEEALWGSYQANYRLSGFVKPDTPPPDKFIQLKVDSTITPSGFKLYSVLLEYPNPIHNVLAVYDEDLTLYLQDNSLNGNIVTEWDDIAGKSYLIASEEFISKDILKLSRISLYTFVDSKLRLVFRSFTKLDKAGKVFMQTITNISNNIITTKITSNQKSKLNGKTDTFNYKNSEHKFKSSQSIFDSFVLNEINNASWLIEKPELIIETVDNANSNNKTQPNNIDVEMKGFQISLNSDWDNPIGISVTEHFISKLEGLRYINNKLGAQITIIKLPEGSTASQFIKYKFGNPTKGDYRVRSTKVIESGKNYIQFFEHSCGDKTFILLLQIPKYTYEKNKNIYDEIITSFFIEC
jgi:hypothetical protein